ncbi:DUF4105 domain-containing protein [Hymenobacter wooponensis]|nr:DUF4105 domain-containing protein [Hymenobacter wooponensis]
MTWMPSVASPVRLSPAAQISLLTCAPGAETYALFGHSALRVSDPALGLDQVYNYGTFDFQTPHFYWRFLRGDLRYFLSAVPFTTFCRGYAQEGRAVSEQVLALQPEEVQRLYTQLETTLHSPAKYYRYQFFADNCSTRLFALLTSSVNEPLQLDSTQQASPPTYRQLLAPYLAPAPWVQLGMNIGLGLPTDRPTTFRQRLFLPVELQQALAHATRQAQPLVAQQRQIVVPANSSASPTGLTPMGLLLGWVVLSILIWQWLSSPAWLLRMNARVLFTVTGLLGCLLTGLSLGSLHTPVQANYQILWLLPSHLLVGLVRSRAWWRYYAVVAIVCSSSVACLPHN